MEKKVSKALQKIKSKKIAGPDHMSVEVGKCMGEVGIQ